MPDTPERLNTYSHGNAATAISTTDQIMAEVRDHQPQHPGASIDVVTTGVVGMRMMEAMQDMVRCMVGRMTGGEADHVKLMKQIRARGMRIEVRMGPLDPGEGEFTDVQLIPFGTADVAVRDDVAIPEAQGCGIKGCALAATHLIHSPAAGLGTWACQCHAAQVEAAIRRKAGG